jgi:hypothetical protein
MNLLPKEFVPLILMFAPLFSNRVWEGAVVLLVGAILAPGERTVSAILRVMGLGQERQFQLSSSAQPGSVVESSSQSSAIATTCERVCPKRGTGDGD